MTDTAREIFKKNRSSNKMTEAEAVREFELINIKPKTKTFSKDINRYCTTVINEDLNSVSTLKRKREALRTLMLFEKIDDDDIFIDAIVRISNAIIFALNKEVKMEKFRLELILDPAFT